jgi:hypothetical protein
VQRVEEHIEDWRRRDAARAAETDANRDQLWAAASERERMLAEVMGEEEAHRASVEEVMKEHRVAFVVHSEEVAQTLEDFAKEKDRLILARLRAAGLRHKPPSPLVTRPARSHPLQALRPPARPLLRTPSEPRGCGYGCKRSTI